jgi:hypothetical protein
VGRRETQISLLSAMIVIWVVRFAAGVAGVPEQAWW